MAALSALNPPRRYPDCRQLSRLRAQCASVLVVLGVGCSAPLPGPIPTPEDTAQDDERRAGDHGAPRTDAAPPEADIDAVSGDEDAVGEDAGAGDGPGDVSPEAADSGPFIVPPEGPWRSLLYPNDWSPDMEPDTAGRFLHDFSYAGYRLGQTLQAPVGTPFDPVDFGADSTGVVDSTGAFQAAIDEASLHASASPTAAAVVAIPAGTFRLDGTLTLTTSRVALRGEGSGLTHLWFTNDALDYAAHLEIRGTLVEEGETPLVSDTPNRSVSVEVSDAGAFAVGDDVHLGWTIDAAFVAEHGMTGVWVPFVDTWVPMFRRTIVAIDATSQPHVVTLDVPVRYPVRTQHGATIRRVIGYLTEVGVTGLSVANAVDEAVAKSHDQVHAFALSGVADGWVDDVTSFAAPNAIADGDGVTPHLQSSGVLVHASKRVTITNMDLRNAQNRGGGGNGYLFEVRQSSEVLFSDCVARRGRHNFIQNWGFGASGIVWLRVDSAEGQAINGGLKALGLSEFHHELAMANLIDASHVSDGWAAVNRKSQSSGAGHTATQSVFWNVVGDGIVRSYQYGHGYVVGTGPDIDIQTVHTPAPPEFAEDLDLWEQLQKWEGTSPPDWTEGAGRADDLQPSSLYEDQLARRVGPQP